MKAELKTAAETKIHPTAIVEKGAQFGVGVEIGPFCIVGPQVSLGDGVKLMSNVQIMGRTSLGAGCEVWPFAVLGGAPQIANYKDADTELVVGDNNIIREHAAMHRGSSGDSGMTRVGSNGMFMVNSHVAHDCIIGDHVIFAHGAVIGGHTHIEDYVILGGLSAVHQNSRVGRHAFVSALCLVTADVIPYGLVVGNPAHLNGLNVVGLRRRNFSREQISDMRTAYRLLFAEEGTFQERVEDVARLYDHNLEVGEMIEFIRVDAARSLCMPHD